MADQIQKYVRITEGQILLALETICGHYDPSNSFLDAELKQASLALWLGASQSIRKQSQDGVTYQIFKKHIDLEGLCRLIGCEIDLWEPYYGHLPKHQRMAGLETFIRDVKGEAETPQVILRVLEDIADFIRETQTIKKPARSRD